MGLVDPVGLPAEPALIASNTDIPCGPMVITIGSPSGDLALTTKDSANDSLVFAAFALAPVFDRFLFHIFQALVVDDALFA